MRWTGEAQPGTPYWWEGRSAPDLPDAPPARADILIIGAGYTGLSAAIAAHDGGASVVVVDAGMPGEGASTRNGGMFGAHPRLSWDALAKAYGEEAADGIVAEAAPALAFGKALIEREGIDCALQPTGRIQLAWTESQFAAQHDLAARITEKSTVRVSIIDRAGLAAEIATGRFFGGMLFHDHCGIQPRAYHDGLLRAVLSRGVPVVPRCAVTGLERVAGGYAAHLPAGHIRADKVILATNGYTTRAFRWHQRRVFPLPSYLIATEPLPADLIASLAPGGRMMVETRARHSYFRISPDGTRLLYGGRAAMYDIPLPLAAERLRATMAQVWPALHDVALGHVWTGNTGYSFGHTPGIGAREGVHYAMGYSGSGTVMAPYLGAKAAWAALGDARAETAYARIALNPHWLHPVERPHFLRVADLWYRRFVDLREMRAGR